MSAYTTCKTAIRDMKYLVKALINMGFKKDQIEVHDKPITMNGYGSQKQEANVIIRRQYTNAYGDMGFVQQADGTMAFVYDHMARQYDARWQDKLTQQYALEALRDQCQINGFFLDNVSTDTKGFIQIEASNPHM